jgi:D-glycero-D-manno-heptose 1,7-bisphosphate phosphatase
MGEHEVTRRAVFLDRDGVLNRPIVRNGRPYPPTRLEEFQLYEDAQDGCARLKAAQFLLVVITNQPDVGRGKQTTTIVESMHKQLRGALPQIDHIEVCYHAGSSYGEPCHCRKPRPGMIERAVSILNINLKGSYVVGDRWRDVDCAHAANCPAVFLDRGYDEALHEVPDFKAASFAEAVDVLLRDATAQYHLPLAAGLD